MFYPINEAFTKKKTGIGVLPIRLRIKNPHSFVMVQPSSFLKASAIDDFLREAAISVTSSKQDMHWISKSDVLIDPLHTQQTLTALFPCRKVRSKWLKTTGKHLHQGLGPGASGSKLSSSSSS